MKNNSENIHIIRKISEYKPNRVKLIKNKAKLLSKYANDMHCNRIIFDSLINKNSKKGIRKIYKKKKIKISNYPNITHNKLTIHACNRWPKYIRLLD